MTDSDAFDELDAQTRRAIRELVRDELGQDRATRRDVLKAAGGGTIAALLGAGGMTAASGRAAADASTSDSDGDLGDPNNRFDAFVDGLDANDVTAGTTFVDPAGVAHTGELADASDVGSGAEKNASANAGQETSAGDVFFEAEFGEIVTPVDYYDANVLHRRHYDDGRYRVVWGDTPAGNTELHTTSDFASFTQVATDILPGVSDSGQCAGLEILNDGTRVFLQSSGAETRLWTGPDLQNLSEQGQFVPEPDGGTYYDPISGTLHYYPEDQDNASGVSSQKLSHWTASDDDLSTVSQQADAIDVSAKPWKTGDPEIIRFGGSYWMFFDNTDNHPNYNIALAKSNDLYNWTIVADSITGVLGGDIALTEYNGVLKGFTEYAQGDDYVGTWTLTPHTADSLFLAEQRTTPADHNIGADQTALYSKSDGQLYVKTRGGSESALGGSGGGGTTVTTASVSASGDGSTTSFTLPHNHPTVPDSVNVDPTTADANATFYVSGATASSVEVTYANAPPSGTDNLGFDVILAGEGTSSAGPPASAIHQYDPVEFTSSNWPDSVGSSDIATISGLTFDSTSFSGAGAVYADGSSYGQSDTMGSFGSNMSSNFAVSVPFNTSAASDNVLLGAQNNNGSTAFVLYANGASFTSSISNLGIQMVDDATNNIRVDTNSSYADGADHHLIINKTGNTAADIQFYVDDMTSPVAVSTVDDGIGTYSDFDVAMTYAARNQGGAVQENYTGDLGTITWFDDSLTESERQTVNDNLGWTA